jgi:hypothetical protein
MRQEWGTVINDATILRGPHNQGIRSFLCIQVKIINFSYLQQLTKNMNFNISKLQKNCKLALNLEK